MPAGIPSGRADNRTETAWTGTCGSGILRRKGLPAAAGRHRYGTGILYPHEVNPVPNSPEGFWLGVNFKERSLTNESRDLASQLFRALSTAGSSAQARANLEAKGFQVEYVEERWGRRLAAVFLDG